MFHGWDSFFLMIGSAAGALIGLLFVVATLTSGLDLDRATRAGTIYLSPIVLHFAIVMVTSAVALAPRLPLAVGLIMGLCALSGLVWATVVAVELRSGKHIQAAHWSDFWWYGALPAALYLALAAAAFSAPAAPWICEPAVATLLMALLLTAIRNAWDLVTYMAPRQNRGA